MYSSILGAVERGRDAGSLSLFGRAPAMYSLNQLLDEIHFPATRAGIVGCACVCGFDESVITLLCTIADRSFTSASDLADGVRNAAVEMNSRPSGGVSP